MNFWMKNEIEGILLYGKNLRKMNLNMNLLGELADQVGILSAL